MAMPDVLGGELAVLLEQLGQHRRAPGPGGGRGVARERGAAEERLEAALVAAGAQTGPLCSMRMCPMSPAQPSAPR